GKPASGPARWKDGAGGGRPGLSPPVLVSGLDGDGARRTLVKPADLGGREAGVPQLGQQPLRAVRRDSDEQAAGGLRVAEQPPERLGHRVGPADIARDVVEVAL